MDFNKFILVVVVFAFITVLHGSEFKNCGSGLGEVLSVNVSYCEGEQRCPLYRGRNATIEIEFIPKSDIEKVVAVVHGVIKGIALPFKNPNKNGCRESGLLCPLETNETQYYRSTIFVKKSYPPIDVGVKYQLKDGNRTRILCVEIPATIKNE